MSPTRALVEASLLVSLAVVLFAASHYLPLVGLFVSLVCPAPLVVLGLRHDLKRALLGTFVATLLTAALLGVVTALFFLLGFGILGIGLGYLARRCKSGAEVMLYGLILSLVSKLALMAILLKITGVNPFGLDGASFKEAIDGVARFYGTVGLPMEAIEGMKGQFEAMAEALPRIFPALLVMASAMDCFLSYVISGAVVKRLGGLRLPPLPSFAQWRFPRSVFWALLASMALQLLGPSLGSFAAEAGLNLRLIVSMLFFFQGLSVVWFFLTSRKMAAAFRFLAVFLLVFIPFLSQLVLVLGVVDIWYDLRNRRRR